MICALVLAAGESRRMGYPKLLLPFKEKTIIEHIVENILASKADKILVVLGSYQEEILSKIADRTVSSVVNHRFREGMLSSIQTGFEALPKETSAAIVCLGDQPLIPFSVMDALIETYHKTKKGVVLPVYRNKRGHPILIDLKHKQEILDLSSDIGLRALVHNHPQDIYEVEVDTPHILKDIDYPEDYQSELKIKEEE
ncbi:MAG: molybdenum cofactor cytidylyltransferase [Candidatus Aminicenantes bacterium]|nr:MAG: molybdenum cofactor cytidylyltransferase [Candidatus Aminicenantes bacterium]